MQAESTDECLVCFTGHYFYVLLTHSQAALLWRFVFILYVLQSKICCWLSWIFRILLPSVGKLATLQNDRKDVYWPFVC